jgi:hypothetical protein
MVVFETLREKGSFMVFDWQKLVVKKIGLKKTKDGSINFRLGFYKVDHF